MLCSCRATLLVYTLTYLLTYLLQPQPTQVRVFPPPSIRQRHGSTNAHKSARCTRTSYATRHVPPTENAAHSSTAIGRPVGSKTVSALNGRHLSTRPMVSMTAEDQGLSTMASSALRDIVGITAFEQPLALGRLTPKGSAGI